MKHLAWIFFWEKGNLIKFALCYRGMGDKSVFLLTTNFKFLSKKTVYCFEQSNFLWAFSFWALFWVLFWVLYWVKFTLLSTSLRTFLSISLLSYFFEYFYEYFFEQFDFEHFFEYFFEYFFELIFEAQRLTKPTSKI